MYQVIEQSIAYTMICLVFTYLVSYPSHARWKLEAVKCSIEKNGSQRLLN